MGSVILPFWSTHDCANGKKMNVGLLEDFEVIFITKEES